MASPFVPGPQSLFSYSLFFGNGLDSQRLREERGRARLFVLNPHTESGEGGRAAQAPVFEEKDGNFAGICGGLQNHGA